MRACTYNGFAPEDSLHCAEYAYDGVYYKFGGTVHPKIPETDFDFVFW